MAYNNGGAPTAVWGWILACSMTMTVVSKPFTHTGMSRRTHECRESVCRVLQGFVPAANLHSFRTRAEIGIVAAGSVHGRNCVLSAQLWWALLLGHPSGAQERPFPGLCRLDDRCAAAPAPSTCLCWLTPQSAFMERPNSRSSGDMMGVHCAPGR